MNADDRLGEASDQIDIASDAETCDAYSERMLSNAQELVERAKRRIKRQRFARDGVPPEEVPVDD